MESRVEVFAQIRRDARVEGLSIRELARRHGVGQPTVRQALLQAEPPPRKPRVRSAPRLDAFKNAIDEMLRLDTEAPRKQKHTARRVFARLADEHGATDLSYSTVRNYIRRRRPEIDAAAGRLQEVFVSQEHAPGAEAEVDFGEVWVILAGVKTKCHMCTFRLSHSGKAIHRVYPTQAQEAFLEGHIDAFDDIGGIPTRHIRYDNLTDAVPAGAEKMNLTTFTIFTIAGSGIWNTLLIGLGALLGTQYQLIDQYSQYLNYAVYAAIAGVIIWLIIRRTHRTKEHPTPDQ